MKLNNPSFLYLQTKTRDWMDSLWHFSELWYSVQQEVVDLLHEIHSNSQISRSLNSTFETLIPKKEKEKLQLPTFKSLGPLALLLPLKDYNQSSIQHNSCSPSTDRNQYVFIKGRNILDGILIANECSRTTEGGSNKGLSSNSSWRELTTRLIGISLIT